MIDRYIIAIIIVVKRWARARGNDAIPSVLMVGKVLSPASVEVVVVVGVIMQRRSASK